MHENYDGYIVPKKVSEYEYEDELFRITDPKEVNFFINNLNKVNNIMKKVSVDSDEFTEESGKSKIKGINYNEIKPNYILKDFGFSSYLFKSEATPRTIEINDVVFNKVETSIVESLNEKLGENLNMFIDDSLFLYQYIKEFKNLVTMIVVCKEFVYIVSKANIRQFARVEDDYYVDDKVKVTDDIEVSIILDKDNQLEMFQKFLTKKGTYEIYFDTNEEKVYIGTESTEEKELIEENEYVCKLTMSPKYFTGNSGMKVDKSSVEFKINSIAQSEDIVHYTIIFDVNGKMKVANTYLAVLI